MDKGKQCVGSSQNVPVPVVGDSVDRLPIKVVGRPAMDGSGQPEGTRCSHNHKRPVGRPRMSDPVPFAEFWKPIIPENLFQLEIPPSFIQKYGKLVATHSILVGPDEQLWEITVGKKHVGEKEGVYIVSGWWRFRMFYKIEVRNICLFKHVGFHEFKVQIFDGEASFIARNRSAADLDA